MERWIIFKTGGGYHLVPANQTQFRTNIVAEFSATEEQARQVVLFFY